MKSVTQIAQEIVTREGGYVNDPDDPGGPTKHGVTLGTLQRLGLDETGDGQIDEMDVRALTRDKAVEIFVQHYFDAPQIDKLPGPIQASVFDMYVNAGGSAIVILQRLLSDMGQRLVVDGIIGPQTIAAAELAQASAPGYFADAYGIARRNYYYRVADARPASRKYATTRAGTKGGWILRAEQFVSPRFHLSAAEHRKRVAKWA
ncbi:peptidoglycan-binding protein [Thioclava dalianensis]|uniref:Peptidoglycan-binding protein n=1 Tax=Thioclava dalianensis TaxID=1185766 RepID=A0A074U5E1_9RHOB|nr:holin-associated N-acetylmuramidase [Thioclava dalianensis]KEP69847.1 peptidoglycan-binding protein [Thioclava dalianensis]SFM87710.1 Predicted Peptidoglycan domain-containing protein [Thioclava dalianensis]